MKVTVAELIALLKKYDQGEEVAVMMDDVGESWLESPNVFFSEYDNLVIISGVNT